jgi:UDP-N-acetylglucosamine--N-acetylmuramyl-(pentapeptide) pyrophosphoryl-undecaprenol N-acetylglucosamine transferase
LSPRKLLCIAGGGTGGHVIPALALAEEVRQRMPHVHTTFIGAQRGLEATLLPEHGQQVLLLTMHSVKGSGMFQRLRVILWELPCAVMRILREWRTARPDLVVGVGGYASVAGVAAALLKRIPVILYEQNAMPGLANRRLATFCARIIIGFSEAAGRLPGHKCVHAGNLVPHAIRDISW